MGIETVITCDRCDRKIEDEDFASIDLRFEIDKNHEVSATDIKRNSHGIYCIPCGDIVWNRLEKENFKNPPKLT